MDKHLKSNSEGGVSQQNFHQKVIHGCRITVQGDQILVHIAITTYNSRIFNCSLFCIEFHTKMSASTRCPFPHMKTKWYVQTIIKDTRHGDINHQTAIRYELPNNAHCGRLEFGCCEVFKHKAPAYP